MMIRMEIVPETLIAQEYFTKLKSPQKLQVTYDPLCLTKHNANVWGSEGVALQIIYFDSRQTDFYMLISKYQLHQHEF